jgi:transcriptional regulator with XRE-family HTH domain
LTRIFIRYRGNGMKQFRFEKIREFRDELGLTQEQLADRIGVHTQQVSAWERRRGNGMTIKSLARICDALGKEVVDFIP